MTSEQRPPACQQRPLYLVPDGGHSTQGRLYLRYQNIGLNRRKKNTHKIFHFFQNDQSQDSFFSERWSYFFLLRKLTFAERKPISVSPLNSFAQWSLTHLLFDKRKTFIFLMNMNSVFVISFWLDNLWMKYQNI